MLKNLYPTRVHVWGGFGSQLFALSLVHDLRLRYPKRKFIAVFHTGGVTERNAEILNLFPTLDHQIIRDFSPTAKQGPSNKLILKDLIRRYVLVILKFTYLVLPANTDTEFCKVKPWTLQIRGHYSNRTISQDFFIQLYKTLLTSTTANIDYSNYDCCVHYRLGDLLYLSNKEPISIYQISQEILLRNARKPFVLLTDSPSEAKQRLSKFIRAQVTCPTTDSASVLVLAVGAKYFVGTSSKLSFWAAAMRANLFKTQSSLPGKNQPQVVGLLSQNLSQINFY